MSDETLVADPEVAVKRACGLIVYLDYTVFDGIATLEKTCEKAFGAVGVTVDKSVFVRSLFGAKMVPSINALVGAGSETKAETVLASIVSAMDKAIETSPPNPAVVDVCKKAIETGCKIIFVTSRAMNVVEARLEALDLADGLVFRADRSDRFGEYSADSWIRAARMIRLNPRHCTAIASSALSVRQAIVAGMRTAAVTNPLINFQDFTGADFISAGNDHDTIVSSVMEILLSQLN